MLVPATAVEAVVDTHPVGHNRGALIRQCNSISAKHSCGPLACILLVETGFATVGDRAVRRYLKPRGGAQRAACLRCNAVPR